MRTILLLALAAGIALAGCTGGDDAATDPTPGTNETNTTPTPTPTPEDPNCVAPAPAPCVEPPAQ